MKKNFLFKFQVCILILSCILRFGIYQVSAQTPGLPYTFASSTPALVVPAAGWTNVVVAAASQDNSISALPIQPAGFLFPFAGVTYNGFVISTNGWIALTNGAGAAPAYYSALGLPNNLLANNTGGLPIIAPLWDDLSCAAFQWQYAAGVLWVRWPSAKWDKTNAVVTSFALKLDQGLGTITFVQPTTAVVPTVPSASIGIAGTCVGDFYSASDQTPTTATVSSVVENTQIGQAGANNARPSNINYVFTPVAPVNDNCAGAIDLGALTVTCTAQSSSNILATTSGSNVACSPAGADNKDVWFSVVKPAGVSDIRFTTGPDACPINVTGTSIEVFSGPCPGASLGCTTAGGIPATYAQLDITGRPICTVETLYVRVTSDGDLLGKFTVCAKNISAATSGTTCPTALQVCGPIPINNAGLTTQGSVNDYSNNVLCQSDYMTGEDFVISYTPSISQCVNISIDGTGINSYPGLFLLDGCPNDTDFSTCVASASNASAGDTIFNIFLTAGHTYYIVVDNNSLAGFNISGYIPFNFHIWAAAAAAPPNDNCAGAAPLGTIPFGVTCVWSTTYTTQCATPSPVAGYPNPVCGGFNPALTNDVWLTFTAGFNGTLLISTQGSGANPVIHGGFAVYQGGCAGLILDGCAGDSVAIAFAPSLSLVVTNTTVYLIRYWSTPGYDPGSFQVCFQANCNPPNDLPTAAQAIPLGVPTLGNTTCSTGNLEMPTPVNCTSAPVTTVWYTIVTPPSGQVAVRISQISLLDAALAAFTIPNPSPATINTFTRLACNDDIIFAPPCPICGMSGDNDAAIQFSATPGSTVYIAVDGEGGAVGTFYITAIEGTLASTFPPVYRKDCANPEFICTNDIYSIPNGGIGSDGNICDYTNLACSPGASTSEVGSTWIQFTVNTPNLGFTITPNDSAAPIANYDFYMWDITGIANVCTTLATTAPIRCNTITGTGKTGLRNPAATVFSALVNPAAGRTYIMNIQNTTSANDDEGAPGTGTGFVLDWNLWSGGVNIGTTGISGTSPTCTWSSPPLVIDTNYQNVANWKGVGNCPAILPSCTTDVFISGANKICTITGSSYAKTITINAGGTLKIYGTGTLHVCGDFINNGTLICMPGSAVIFEGPGAQNISGALTGANSFANVFITKGTLLPVTLFNNMDVTQNFTVSNATSVFSINGKYMKVGGNFTNWNLLTFTGSGGSTVEFNGSINQYYTNTSGIDTLNRVTINKTGGKVYLNGVFSSMFIDTVLTLTAGNIVTTPTLEVFAKYGIVGAVTGYSANSYIDGRLRRKLFLGSIDFPVGDSAVTNQGGLNGYELMNITFTSSTVVPDLLAWFNTWGLTPPPLGPVGPDFCANGAASYTTSYNTLPIFDNGYWSVQRASAFFNGAYNITLYNTGGTNNTGIAWTVATAALAAVPTNPASWWVVAPTVPPAVPTPQDGVCALPSSAAVTRRTTYNSPAAAGGASSFNMLFATVQATVLLPIELIYFTAEPAGEDVMCKWETASETNNDYFEVERSINGSEYVSIGKVRGYGLGISTENRSYSIVDHSLCNDIRYYRLKQYDIDGHVTYSDVVAINCLDNKKKINVYPNPGNTTIFSSFYESNSGSIKLQWLDVLGKIVKEEIHDVVKGYNTVQSDITDLSKGIYYLRIRETGEDSQDNDRQIKFLKN